MIKLLPNAEYIDKIINYIRTTTFVSAPVKNNLHILIDSSIFARLTAQARWHIVDDVRHKLAEYMWAPDDGANHAIMLYAVIVVLIANDNCEHLLTSNIEHVELAAALGCESSKQISIALRYTALSDIIKKEHICY